MHTLFSFFTPSNSVILSEAKNLFFLAAAEGQRGFPCFHYFAIPLLILSGFAIGWFIRGRRSKVEKEQ